MKAISSNPLFSLFKKLSFLYFSLFFIFSNSANAVLINFDDLDPNDYSYEGGNPYLTNEYASQGLVFENAAYLLAWSGSAPSVSSPNYVGGPGFGFKFIGELPTSVSFYLSSSSHMAVFIDAFGPNYTFHTTSSGENHGGWPEDLGSPYIPNELFSFYSPTGISSVEFSGRGDVNIDDLAYNYSLAQVPEPSAFILLLIGLLGLSVSHLKCRVSSFR